MLGFPLISSCPGGQVDRGRSTVPGKGHSEALWEQQMPVSTGQHLRETGRNHAVHVGFVPLIDAAPLIVAFELGYFDDEGLDVHLRKQIGWGNVRDRLTYGELHASHAPMGMVPASLARLSHYDEPLTALMALGAGGNAITIAPQLAAIGAGVTAPAAWRRHLGRPIRLAYVFPATSHQFALCELIAAAGLRIGRDAELCVLPPSQMPALLARGAIDGFCAGEPWNTVAATSGSGVIFCATTESAPDHPEKVLAVTRKWCELNASMAERLVRATLRGCDYCDDILHHGRLAEILAKPEYLAVDENIIAKSLLIDQWLHPNDTRPRFRSFSRAAAVPRVQSVEWFLRRMIRYGALPESVDVMAVARDSVLVSAYERAVVTSPEPDVSSATSISLKSP
jgi:ABC-type nitrate/sulfonate/bicarbonate transport system substrate-binding protein